jgi:hypothetical protein
MEIIEKQVEKVKEVPADNYGYNYGRRDINGKANAGLTLGIIGTALGAWALFGGRRSASLLGGTGTGSGADANIAIATCGGSANGVNAPTAFQAWEKECEDTLREMEMFRKFREFSKAHPEVTYDEFIKANM